MADEDDRWIKDGRRKEFSTSDGSSQLRITVISSGTFSVAAAVSAAYGDVTLWDKSEGMTWWSGSPDGSSEGQAHKMVEASDMLVLDFAPPTNVTHSPDKFGNRLAMMLWPGQKLRKDLPQGWVQRWLRISHQEAGGVTDRKVLIRFALRKNLTRWMQMEYPTFPARSFHHILNLAAPGKTLQGKPRDSV